MGFTYTTVPAAGAKLRASVLSALISELRPLRAIQTANVTKNNNTTLATLTGLSLAALASQVYKFRGRIVVNGANTTHDVKIGMSLPAGATIEWSCYAHATASTAAVDTMDIGSTTGLTHSRSSIAGLLTYIIEGVITMSTTAGNIVVQGAQDTANASDCVFQAGSVFELYIQ